MPPPDKILGHKVKLTEPSLCIEPGLEINHDAGLKGPEPDNNFDSKSAEYKAKCRLHSLLRDIRADFQIIRSSLIELITLSSGSNKNACSAETPEIHKKNIDRCSLTIDDKLNSIHDLFDKYPCISSHYSDTVQIIENKWELFTDLFVDYKNDELNKICNLEKCKQYLEENIYSCSFLTVPARVTAHLETLKSGYSLNFYDEFKDEFCSKEQSDELLKYLARHPAFIDDIIDVSQGLIFKVEPKNKRWSSYARVFGAFVLGIGTIVGSIWILEEQVDQEYIIQIMKMYSVFVCGALLHMFIDAMKATKSSTGLTFKSVEDWLLWAHIKELPIITGILLLDFTFIALVTTFDISDILTFAAAGYSFDSIGEVILGRFETILSKKGGVLKEKISSM